MEFSQVRKGMEVGVKRADRRRSTAQRTATVLDKLALGPRRGRALIEYRDTGAVVEVRVSRLAQIVKRS